MTMTRVYSVYDSKAETYSTPIFERNNASMIRSFTKAANTQEHDFNTFAGDYTLFCIAEWDERSGELFPLKTHENLGLAINYIKGN